MKTNVSRRDFTAGAAAFAVLPWMGSAAPAFAAQFCDAVSLEKIADGDATVKAPFVVAALTPVWWR